MLPHLPEVENVRWLGWAEDRFTEIDLWVEDMALKRIGWSETQWRRWLSLLVEEAAQRRAFENDMARFCGRLGAIERVLWREPFEWGPPPMSNMTRCQETAWYAMMAVELERRLAWGASMRSQHGYGQDQISWLNWTIEWGLWRRWNRQMGEDEVDYDGEESAEEAIQ